MPIPIFRNNTPSHMLFRHKPKYTLLRVFSCLCYPWLQSFNTHKLEPRSRPCVYLDFSLSHHSFLCFDTHSNRHVVFFEHLFPYKTKSYPDICLSYQTFSKFLSTFIGKHLDKVQAPTDDSIDSIVWSSSTPHLIHTPSTQPPSTTPHVSSPFSSWVASCLLMFCITSK